MNAIEAALIKESGIAAREPAFTFAALGPVRRIVISRDLEQSETVVELEAFASNRQAEVILLTMRGARGRVPAVGDWVGPAELFIDDVSTDQLDGIRYRVHDEGGGFGIHCASLRMTVVPA
jgi:hypothetical protein